MVGPKNDSSSKNRHESFSSVSIIEVIKINVGKKCAPKLLFSIKKKKQYSDDYWHRISLWKSYFWHTVIRCSIHKMKQFPLSMLIFGQQFKDPPSKKFHNRTVAKKYFINFLPVSCMGRSWF